MSLRDLKESEWEIQKEMFALQRDLADGECNPDFHFYEMERLESELIYIRRKIRDLEEEETQMRKLR